MHYFDHEKLKVYQKALDFIDWSKDILLKSNYKSSLKDQFERASTSIVLNIAEGNGKFYPKDRCRYFDIARGSALESSACLDVLFHRNLTTEDQVESDKKILNEIVAMLVGLIKSNSDRIYESNIKYNVKDIKED